MNLYLVVYLSNRIQEFNFACLHHSPCHFPHVSVSPCRPSLCLSVALRSVSLSHFALSLCLPFAQSPRLLTLLTLL
jgi:hypothetical protein